MSSRIESMSKIEQTAYRKIKLKEIREHNKFLIDDLDIAVEDFNMKKAFTRNGVIVVGMFDNEFKKEKGFYFELIDSNLEPDDINRTVYRLAPTLDYQEEYEMDEYGKFLVPLEELRIINRQSVAISKESAATSSDSVLDKTKYTPIKSVKVENQYFTTSSIVEDALYSQMTIRDYIAIHSGEPVSEKKWLNELVKRK